MTATQWPRSGLEMFLVAQEKAEADRKAKLEEEARLERERLRKEAEALVFPFFFHSTNFKKIDYAYHDNTRDDEPDEKRTKRRTMSLRPQVTTTTTTMTITTRTTNGHHHHQHQDEQGRYVCIYCFVLILVFLNRPHVTQQHQNAQSHCFTNSVLLFVYYG